jgi:hypothetical protein
MFTGWRYGPKEPDYNAENFLISFNTSSPQSYKKWTNVIEDLLSGIVPSGHKQNKIVSLGFQTSVKLVVLWV